MANTPIIGGPFDLGVQDQLKIRSVKQRISNLTDKDLAVQHGSTGWVRLSSSVIIEGAENEYAGIKNVLQGGVKIKRGAGFNPDSEFSSYSKTSELGFRPMPGIDSVEIASQNAQGTTRKSDIQFKVHTLEDLEIYEKLFMRPGFLILMEYGHSSYYDNDGNIITEPSSTIDFFNKTDIQQVQDEIKQLEKSSDYNYSAELGYVLNFEYSYNESAGYDCMFQLLSLGSLAEGLKLGKSGDITQEGSLLEKLAGAKKPEQDKSYQSSEVLRILGKFYETAGQRDGVLATLDDLFPTLELKPDNVPVYLHNISTDITNGSKKVYITINTLLMIFNKTIMPAADKKVLFNFGYSTKEYPVNSKFLTYPDHFSSNPNICLLKKVPADKQLYFGSGGFIPSPKAPKGNSINTDILVDVSFLKSRLQKLTENKKEDRTVVDYLQDILLEINTSLGSINKLDFQYIENDDHLSPGGTFYIVDRNVEFDRVSDVRSNIIPCKGKGSLLKNISVKSNLEQQTINAMAASAVAQTLPDGDGPNWSFNQGLTSRLGNNAKPQDEQSINLNTGENDDDKSYKKKIDTVKKAVKQFVKGRSFKEAEGKSLAETHKDIANYDVNRALDPHPGDLPYSISFTMKGISGIRAAQAFRLQDGILPTNVQRRAAFVVKHFNHSIANNQWTTEVAGYFELVEPDKNKILKQFYEKPLEADVQDKIDNFTDKSS